MLCGAKRPGSISQWLSAPSGWSCLKAQPMFQLHVLVFNNICPSCQGNVSTCAEICSRCNVAEERISLANKRLNCFGSPLFNFDLKWAATRAKFCTRRLYTLHNPTNDFTSVTVFGDLKSVMVSVLCKTSSNRLGRKTCPK